MKALSYYDNQINESSDDAVIKLDQREVYFFQLLWKCPDQAEAARHNNHCNCAVLFWY